MQLAYDINLVIHALAGLIALVALAGPLVSKKGGRVHRRIGWVFSAAMAVIALTGLGLALSWMIAPLAVEPLAFSPIPRDASVEQIASRERSVRAFGLFFATIALMAGTAVWQGISAVRLREPRPASDRRWFGICDHLAWILPGVAGLGLLVPGIRYEQPLFLGFAALALFNSITDARFVIRPLDQAGAWLIRHLQAMLGGATVAVTAFTVLTLRRYVAPEAGLQFVFWAIPVFLGVGATVIWTRIYKRRLGYGGAHAAA